jgi:hypothetical protein
VLDQLDLQFKGDGGASFFSWPGGHELCRCGSAS